MNFKKFTNSSDTQILVFIKMPTDTQIRGTGGVIWARMLLELFHLELGKSGSEIISGSCSARAIGNLGWLQVLVSDRASGVTSIQEVLRTVALLEYAQIAWENLESGALNVFYPEQGDWRSAAGQRFANAMLEFSQACVKALEQNPNEFGTDDHGKTLVERLAPPQL